MHSNGLAQNSPESSTNAGYLSFLVNGPSLRGFRGSDLLENSPILPQISKNYRGLLAREPFSQWLGLPMARDLMDHGG